MTPDQNQLPASLHIEDMRPEDARAFHDLNSAWITQFFTMEAPDRRLLENPQTEILDRGGVVLVARAEDASGVLVVAGCVALIPKPDGVYELAKMAVDPAFQGAGIGARLVTAATERGRLLGARRIFIETSRKLPNAIRLYERLGFRHLVGDEVVASPYDRCDVQMALDF